MTIVKISLHCIRNVAIFQNILERTEHQKITNFLDKTNNQSSKFRTKNWVEVNDGSHKKYSPGGKIKFKTMMLRLSPFPL